MRAKKSFKCGAFRVACEMGVAAVHGQHILAEIDTSGNLWLEYIVVKKGTPEQRQ